MFNHPNIIKYLVSKDADMEIMDTDQRTPLLLAATRECWESVRTLVELGANWLVKVRTFLLRIKFDLVVMIMNVYSCNCAVLCMHA